MGAGDDFTSSAVGLPCFYRVSTQQTTIVTTTTNNKSVRQLLLLLLGESQELDPCLLMSYTIKRPD